MESEYLHLGGYYANIWMPALSAEDYLRTVNQTYWPAQMPYVHPVSGELEIQYVMVCFNEPVDERVHQYCVAMDIAMRTYQ